ncbi:MAG: transcriptional repressor [Candidatus Tectomicrobia bacterium]|uniref:Transcriptional repressor n=1 Tax=Tectimicrobiota bacterium TaxID=2528274 RepID=A0A932I1P2_UNCTE|nr:transcriptional repressor [Candidatus Tectomicrobia bacterium]
MAGESQVQFPESGHDHAACVADALERASELCARRGARLTAIRRRVLELVWGSHAPVGAYDILARMDPGGRRGGAPATVYRALDFLIAQGFVHRLSSVNAFVGCGVPDNPHMAQFLICRGCGAVAEMDEPRIEGAIGEAAARAGFEVETPVIEVQGRCPACREKAQADAR